MSAVNRLEIELEPEESGEYDQDQAKEYEKDQTLLKHLPKLAEPCGEWDKPLLHMLNDIECEVLRLKVHAQNTLDPEERGNVAADMAIHEIHRKLYDGRRGVEAWIRHRNEA